ncbi:MAG: hypothetical protein IT236_03715 [Bacteroidia bacterium]|nr:hypothetical protein [Bacteroidia bacterium]
MIKKIGIKLILLLLVVTGLNFIYTYTLFDADLKEKSPEAIAIKASVDSTDIYYFGESSNVTYRPDDSIKTSISELSGLFFPKLKVTNINKFATHGGIYKQWLFGMRLKQHKPGAIVITLNLRSFDATWINSKLETPLQESLVLTKPYPNLINRFMLSLQAFDNRSEKQREQEVIEEWTKTQLEFPFEAKYSTVKQWDDGMANGGHLKADGTWDTDKISLACHYIKGYAFNLNENNPRVKDFDAIFNWCKENKISLYLNLMAENLDYASDLVGRDLVVLMKQNRDFLMQRYNREHCVVVDNLELVSGKEFIDQNWTSEHYDYKGRMRIAKHLATALKKQFENNYKEAY